MKLNPRMEAFIFSKDLDRLRVAPLLDDRAHHRLVIFVERRDGLARLQQFVEVLGEDEGFHPGVEFQGTSLRLFGQ